MFDIIIYNARVFHKGTFISNAGIGLENGKITCIDSSDVICNLDAAEKINLCGEILAPGYIDLHIHGLLNYLVDNGKDDLEKISANLPRFGTTSFLPTIIPHPLEEEVSFLHSVAQANTPGAEYLGFFIEGPFLAKTGAIHPDALVDKTPERVLRISKSLNPYKVVFAISPEIPNLKAVMEKMNQPIFITHTQAGVQDSQKAVALGANHATHFYDVFHLPEEKDPGVRPCGAVEVILQNPDVSVDFVLDGEHVAPIAVKLALACKPLDKVCLITDSNVGAGLPPGKYQGFGGEEVEFSYPGSPARGTENSRSPGGLYGSGLTMDRAVKNVIKFGVGTAEAAITMASTSPAKVLGVYGRKGDIAAGFDADFLHLDSELNVKRSWVGGKLKFDTL
ncbi:MAG: amidohydrolase family protein [Spirochaetales bacterium]|nr:amidohydrolase family protein [Spirochaetales bacterium]